MHGRGGMAGTIRATPRLVALFVLTIANCPLAAMHPRPEFGMPFRSDFESALQAMRDENVVQRGRRRGVLCSLCYLPRRRVCYGIAEQGAGLTANTDMPGGRWVLLACRSCGLELEARSKTMPLRECFPEGPDLIQDGAAFKLLSLASLACLECGQRMPRPPTGGQNATLDEIRETSSPWYCTTHKRRSPSVIQSVQPPRKVTNEQDLPIGINAAHRLKMRARHRKKREGKRVRGVYCVAVGCGKVASFGDAERRVAETCVEHKREGYLHVKCKMCQVGGCERRALYGDDKQRLAVCRRHKLPHHEQASPKCKVKGCKISPSFGAPGSSPKGCRMHKKLNDVDVRNKRCSHEGCELRPNFGDPLLERLGKRAVGKRFCAEHKPKGFIDVVSRRCEGVAGELCHRIPSFGPRLGGKRSRCWYHRHEGDIDLKNARRNARKAGLDQQKA